MLKFVTNTYIIVLTLTLLNWEHYYIIEKTIAIFKKIIVIKAFAC